MLVVQRALREAFVNAKWCELKPAGSTLATLTGRDTIEN